MQSIWTSLYGNFLMLEDSFRLIAICCKNGVHGFAFRKIETFIIFLNSTVHCKVQQNHSWSEWFYLIVVLFEIRIQRATNRAPKMGHNLHCCPLWQKSFKVLVSGRQIFEKSWTNSKWSKSYQPLSRKGRRLEGQISINVSNFLSKN